MTAMFELPVGHAGHEGLGEHNAFAWELAPGTHIGSSFLAPTPAETAPPVGVFETQWESWEADPMLSSLISTVLNTVTGPLNSLFSQLAPLAGQLAPGVAHSLRGLVRAASTTPPLAGATVQQGEIGAGEVEERLFGPGEAVPEVGVSGQAHEAALTEVLAAEAAEAPTALEAAATIAATLPLTITIMRADQPLRPVVPALTQATGRLTTTLIRQGPAGRQLLRTVPAIQRRTVATLVTARRGGQRVTTPLAVQALAASAHNVLGNPRRVHAVVARNAAIRHRAGPPNPRRRLPDRSARVAPAHPRRASLI